MLWDPIGFCTTSSSWHCCGSVCSYFGCGSGVGTARARHRSRLSRPSRNAPRNSPPWLASSTHRGVPPVNRPRHPARRPPVRRSPCSLAHGDTDARSRHGTRAVLMMRAPTTAGWAGATSAPTGLRTARHSGSASVCRAMAIARRRMAPRGMGSGCRPTWSYGRWGH